MITPLSEKSADTTKTPQRRRHWCYTMGSKYRNTGCGQWVVRGGVMLYFYWSMGKPILDPCCWGRMFYFDKQNPHVLYGDIRYEERWFIVGRDEFGISPDEIIDFRNIQYPDKRFKMVVFDPPHLTSLWENSWMAKKYGKLWPSWQEDIKQWFSECRRVLDDYGTLIFKRNETDIPVSKILSLIDQQPIFWHKSGKQQKTHRLCFMKFPY